MTASPKLPTDLDVWTEKDMLASKHITSYGTRWIDPTIPRRLDVATKRDVCTS